MSTIRTDAIVDRSGGNTATVNGIPLRPGVLDPENRIINGAFDYWQRGTSFSAPGYSADRWVSSFVGGSLTTSRQSFALGDTLGSNSPTFFLRQSASGQTLASHRSQIVQYIEGVRSYAGQTITLLGWARRSSGAGNFALEFGQAFGTGGSPSVSVTNIGTTTVALTGSWAPFAVTVAVPSITGKTLGTNGDDYLFANFWTSAGSDFNSRTNSLGLQTIGVDFWGIHIKVGTHTVDAVNLYTQPELGPELMRCQRYYWNSAPSFVEYRAYQVGGSVFYAPMTLPVRMRAQPTFAVVSPTYGNASAGVAGGANGGQQAFFIQATCSVTGSASITTQVTADAEL